MAVTNLRTVGLRVLGVVIVAAALGCSSDSPGGGNTPAPSAITTGSSGAADFSSVLGVLEAEFEESDVSSFTPCALPTDFRSENRVEQLQSVQTPQGLVGDGTLAVRLQDVAPVLTLARRPLGSWEAHLVSSQTFQAYQLAYPEVPPDLLLQGVWGQCEGSIVRAPATATQVGGIIHEPARIERARGIEILVLEQGTTSPNTASVTTVAWRERGWLLVLRGVGPEFDSAGLLSLVESGLLEWNKSTQSWSEVP